MPKHAIIGEELFMIIQGRGFPSIPPRPLYAIDDIFDKADLPSRFIYDLWWTINDFPFLMAVPVGRPFYGPLFDRLDYEVDRFPVVCRGHETKWSLHPKVIHTHENVNSLDVPATVDAPSFPPVVPYSSQKRGEDWKTFFSRCEKANKVSLEAESAVDKQARESRQKHANKQKAPGKKGARVYIWDEIDGHRIGHQHVDAVWEDYGDQQRRYNAFCNEWDLCSEFGKDDPYYSDDDHEAPLLDFPLLRVGVDQNDDIEMPTRLLPEEPLNLPLGPDRSVYDLQQEDPEDAPDAYQFSDTAEDRAYYRFGFVNPVAQIAPPVTSHQPTSWNFCREYLGNGRWLGTVSVSSSAAPPPEVQASMCIFFDFLLHSNKIDDIPDEIFDARTQRLDTGLVHLQSEHIDGTKYYFLRPKN
ncbi:hypothetical protein H0H81_005468, partial [Sphagnurus paluster]